MIRTPGLFAIVSFLAFPLLAQEPWEINSGRTSIQFYDHTLKDLGFQLKSINDSARPHREGYFGFSFSPEPEMGFETAGGDFEYLHSGTVTHDGGFTLVHGRKTFSFQDFRIEIVPGTNDGLLLTAEGLPAFRLVWAHTFLTTDTLRMRNMDLVATEELGNAIGIPGLRYTLVGTVDMVLDVSGPPNIRLGVCEPNFNGDVDIELTTISQPGQYAREEGVRVALTASAALANVGTADVPWYRAIEPDGVPPLVGQHPYLLLHFYRIHNGVLEQLGQSDVKHAFWTVNNNCDCPGGNVIYVGCTDVYGGSTNVNPYHLGPREELNALTGDWESLGSHFDGDPVDNWRSHGSTGHDRFEHRLTVADADLQEPDARYFFELWYLVKDDINIFNNMGWLEVIPSLPSSNWVFSVPDPERVPGPAIDAWVDPDQPEANQVTHTVQSSDGHFRLAVKVSDSTPHTFEYALMNLDMDRQIRSFSVPLGPNAAVTNVAFGRPGISTPDDWIITVEEDRVTWEAPPGKGLDWGSLANFRFEGNAPPKDAPATLLPLEAGTAAQFTAQTLTPGDCMTLSEIQPLLPQWSDTFTILEIIPQINQRCAF